MKLPKQPYLHQLQNKKEHTGEKRWREGSVASQTGKHHKKKKNQQTIHYTTYTRSDKYFAETVKRYLWQDSRIAKQVIQQNIIQQRRDYLKALRCHSNLSATERLGEGKRHHSIAIERLDSRLNKTIETGQGLDRDSAWVAATWILESFSSESDWEKAEFQTNWLTYRLFWSPRDIPLVCTNQHFKVQLPPYTLSYQRWELQLK